VILKLGLETEMSKQNTLQLPDAIVQQARETAKRTGRAVEAVLEAWLTSGAASEGIYALRTDVNYEVWSPYDSADTAEDLKQMLEKHK
jgi:hypothetical protein